MEDLLQDPWLKNAREVKGKEGESHPLSAEVVENLSRFSTFSAMKKAAIEAIAFSMSNTSIRNLREQFERVDQDHSGMISLKELRDLLQNHTEISDEAVDKIFRGINKDKSSSISYSEFLAAAVDRKFYVQESHAREAFRRLDVDNTGFISPDNLRVVLGADYSPELVEQMIRVRGCIITICVCEQSTGQPGSATAVVWCLLSSVAIFLLPSRMAT